MVDSCLVQQQRHHIALPPLGRHVQRRDVVLKNQYLRQNTVERKRIFLKMAVMRRGLEKTGCSVNNR
jgi:hypothetical protein